MKHRSKSNMSLQKKVSKIAIVNPYIQRGLVESSEVEATIRFIKAAKNIGIEAREFKSSEDIFDFDPDFVIPISYQEPKLTRYPTYGLLIMTVRWVIGSPRFLRNICSYDGNFAVSTHVYDWLNNVCKATNKAFHVANAAFTVPRTEFKELDLRNAKAAYMGVNWDGLRHHGLFQHFEKGDYLKCFGPRESWVKYPANLYGGKIPFDGFSALENYANHGIGLCINHPDHDRDGVPTCRIFEIVASSAVALCTNNIYYKNNFGDTVLYVDMNLNSDDLAAAIKEKIDWVRSHPNEAKEMARAAHEIFNEQLSLEVMIENMVKMHYEVVRNNGFIKTTMVEKPKITYTIRVNNIDTIDNLINDINNQTYENADILLLIDQSQQMHADKLKQKQSHNNKIHILNYNGLNSNAEIIQFFINNRTEWFGIINNDDRLFPNHSSLLMKNYSQSRHNKNDEATAIVFSNSLEHTDTKILSDKIQDPHMLYLQSNVRVGNVTPCGNIPSCAVLFKLTQPMLDACKGINFGTDLKIDYATSTDPLEVAIHANEITCSSSMANSTMSTVLIIKNATSPFNFHTINSQRHADLLLNEHQRQQLLETNN